MHVRQEDRILTSQIKKNSDQSVIQYPMDTIKQTMAYPSMINNPNTTNKMMQHKPHQTIL